MCSFFGGGCTVHLSTILLKFMKFLLSRKIQGFFFWLQKVVVFGLSRYLVRDPFSFSFIRNKFHLQFFCFSVQNLHWKKLNYVFKFPPLFPELYSFSQISETNCEISLNVCTWILENSLRFKENTFSKNSQTISAFHSTQFFTISCSILVFLKVFSSVF